MSLVKPAITFEFVLFVLAQIALFVLRKHRQQKNRNVRAAMHKTLYANGVVMKSSSAASAPLPETSIVPQVDGSALLAGFIKML
jgi:hypothetical protein